MPSCCEPEPERGPPTALAVVECLTAEFVAQRTSGISPFFRPRFLQVARVFQRFINECAFAVVDAEAVDTWVCRRLGRLAVETVLLDLRCLRRLFRSLTPNPVTEWLACHPVPQRELQAVKSTFPPPTRTPLFVSLLAADFEAFLAHKRRLGRKYCEAERLLRVFDRFLQSHTITRIEDLTGRLLEDFAATLARYQPLTRSQTLSTVRRFFHFLRRTARLTGTPDAVLRLKRRGRPQRPYIFTLKELEVMLKAVQEEATWEGLTAFTALHLIYACGLRSSEAVHLRVQDVDLTGATLWIHRTKFGKSRHIPTGRRATERMAAYLAARQQRFGPPDPQGPFFVTRCEHGMRAVWLREHFRRVCLQVGMNPTDRPAPRLHDLRHSFALHRLYKWYAEGHRPQDKLVLLSMYMGHVDFKYTAHYLQATTELLRLAGAPCDRQLDTILEKFRRSDGG